ncbi:MAG: DUF2480 family protein [Ekhidna sp.]|nr:DUF2480 family protein [Ekhidna sp.]
MEEIINRVKKSPLISIDLEAFLHKGERVIFDLKDLLFQGMILKEEDLRRFIRTNDWSHYRDKNVGLVCSADAIVPTWAYMLLAVKIKEYANMVTSGNEAEIEKALIDQAIEKCLNSQDFLDRKVVIKGCGNIRNAAYAHTRITEKLFSKVSSLMYGEPCSTVPIFKRKK